MDVTWQIEPTATGCRVEIEHEFAPRSALWATLVNGLFVRPIAGRTLATFKAIAEAVVASGVTAPERSGSRPPTKTQA
jgi:ribosome-associated toxin RatA of RatAB toxin-antitoxin module